MAMGYRRFLVKHASCEMTMPQTLPQCCHWPTSPAGLLGVIIAAVTWHVTVPADCSLVTLTAPICPQSVEQTSTTQGVSWSDSKRIALFFTALTQINIINCNLQTLALMILVLTYNCLGNTISLPDVAIQLDSTMDTIAHLSAS